MAIKDLPSLDLLRQLIQYDPNTGEAYWRPRTPDMFIDGKYSKHRKAASWNRKHADKPAGSLKKDGYLTIRIDGKKYQLHRILYSIYFDECLEPNQEIDHKNGNPSDNKIINLRKATRTQQIMNTKTIDKSISGCKGVAFDKESFKWHSRIVVDGKTISLGRFTDKLKAIAARKDAEQKYHGEFARV